MEAAGEPGEGDEDLVEAQVGGELSRLLGGARPPSDPSEAELSDAVEELVAWWASRPVGRRRLGEAVNRRPYSRDQRLLILDAWIRSRLPAKDFSGLVGVSVPTRLDPVTRRAILLLKETILSGVRTGSTTCSCVRRA